MTGDDVQDFRATLYFDGMPALSDKALIEAWSREGYECERYDDRGVFCGLRGEALILVGKPTPAEKYTVPAHYPAATLSDIDWSKTFCVDAKAGYDDLSRATHQANFMFRLLADKPDPRMAHNEIAATLLGIHQVTPMRAVIMHYLDLIVGRANLDDYLNYANSHLDQPAQMASMLAFGAFVTQDECGSKAWTTGLEHFGQANLVFNSPAADAAEALLAVFGLGHLVVNGRRFKANDLVTSFDLSARFESFELDGKPMLRVIKR